MHLLPLERRMVFSPGSHFESLILFELKLQLLSGGGAPYFAQRYCKGRVIVGMLSEAIVDLVMGNKGEVRGIAKGGELRF